MKYWNDQKPKGFLQLGKKSIIEESIDKLIRNGIEKIWIVTGYQSGQFKELIKIYKSTISLIKSVWSLLPYLLQLNNKLFL